MRRIGRSFLVLLYVPCILSLTVPFQFTDYHDYDYTYDYEPEFENIKFNETTLFTGELGDGVEFLLYTRETQDLPEQYSIFEDYENNFFSNFSPKRETKIIIHGWRARAPGKFTETLRKAYMATGDYNLVMVNWSNGGSLERYYTHAKSKVPSVGIEVAAFIDKLCSSFNIDPDKLHIIGHSLGAHVAGVAGRLVSNGVIGRITGLDPAGPLYSKTQVNDRLSESSAKFVDVIHTCGYFLGMKWPIGHVNFYPNFGIPSQPGCGFDYNGVCSHQRAYRYFAESIKHPTGFMANKCSSAISYGRNLCSSTPKIPMGEATPSNVSGSYYLRTNSRIPFARG